MANGDVSQWIMFGISLISIVNWSPVLEDQTSVCYILTKDMTNHGIAKFEEKSMNIILYALPVSAFQAS